jgi:hypothetical protein
VLSVQINLFVLRSPMANLKSLSRHADLLSMLLAKPGAFTGWVNASLIN